MSDSVEDEAQAEAWLRARGYTATRPAWLSGRNPDFWAESACSTPRYLWVEVKSIEPDDGTAVLSKFHPLIATARIPPDLQGHGLVHIAPGAAEQSVQWVLKEFAQQAPRFADEKVLLAFVQQTRNGRDVRRAEIDANVPERLWVRGAGSGPIHPPLRVCKESFAQAKVFYPGGEVRVGKTFEFCERTGSSECSLVARLDPNDRPLNSLDSMSGGSGQTRDRAARALEAANGQIKSACTWRDAPGIVLLVPRASYASDEMIAAAAYGHLTIPLTLKGDTVEHGQLFHGSDGVFRSHKNTHISAAVRLRRDGSATIFPNPFGRHPILDEAPIFAGMARTNVTVV